MKKIREQLKKSKILVKIVKKTRKFFTRTYPRSPERDAFKDMLMLCQSINLARPIFIDGGAHNGSTILKIRDEGFLDSKIIAFEPIPEIAESIYTFKDKDVVVITKALGEKNETVDFNVNKRAVTSSILEPDMVKKYHPGVADLSQKISVQSVRLDSLVSNNTIPSPDIIKLDLQGYELFALRGSQGVLSKVKMILTEVEFVSLYKDQPLFCDVSEFLKQNNFSLFNLYSLGTHDDGQLVAGDALFVNNLYFNKEKLH